MRFHRWIPFGWTAWLIFIVAVAIQPFLWHLNVFRQVDARLFRLLLIVLPLLALADVAYHFLRRRGFWRYEPVVLPAAFLLLCALYAPWAVIVTLWILTAAFVVGRQITDWVGTSGDFSISTLAGLGLFSCALFVIGMNGAFRPWVFAVLFGVPLVALGRNLSKLFGELQSMRQAWAGDPEMASPQVSLAVFSAMVLALLTTAAIVAPVWEGDAIRSHLALARAYLIQHSVAVPPTLIYGYYPQGFEVLASAAYGLGGQTAAQCVNPAFFCLALLLVYQVARCCGMARSWAVVGVVLGASVPFLHWAGSIVKNDLPMAAYQLAALLFYLRWRENSNFRWILASAFFLAMSFGVKHVALFGAIPLGLAIALAVWRQPRRWTAALSVAGVLVAFGLFWQTRTYLAKGDPLFPARAAIASPLKNPERGRAVRLLRYLTLPYRVHFRGTTRQYASPNPMGISLLLLAPLWLIPAAGGRPRRTEAMLWFFLCVYYAYWCLAGFALRYAIVPVLLLAVLGAARLAILPRWLGVTGMAVGLLFAMPVLLILEMAPAQLPLLAKQIDGATFLRRTLAPYGAVEFLAKRAALSDHVASVGDWAVAYSPNPGTFLHLYRDDRRYGITEVRQVLEGNPSRYLILPNGSNLADLEGAARQYYKMQRLYADHDFVVYSLTP